MILASMPGWYCFSSQLAYGFNEARQNLSFFAHIHTVMVKPTNRLLGLTVMCSALSPQLSFVNPAFSILSKLQNHKCAEAVRMPASIGKETPPSGRNEENRAWQRDHLKCGLRQPARAGRNFMDRIHFLVKLIFVTMH